MFNSEDTFTNDYRNYDPFQDVRDSLSPNMSVGFESQTDVWNSIMQSKSESLIIDMINSLPVPTSNSSQTPDLTNSQLSDASSEFPDSVFDWS